MEKEIKEETLKRYHLYARGKEVELYKWLQEEAERQDRSFNNMVWQAVKALKKSLESTDGKV